jgi:hypothetical protein
VSYNSLFGLGGHSEDANLEIWLPLQDDAASVSVDDRSSNNYAATLEGGDDTTDLSTSGPNNWLTKAFDFDGAADYVDTQYRPTDQAELSWLSRFRLDAAAGIGSYLFGAATTQGTNQCFYDGNDIRYRLDAGGATDVLNGPTETKEVWRSFASSYNGSTVRSFFNGTFQASSAASGTVDQNGVFNTFVGAVTNSLGVPTPNLYFDGRLCDFAAFSRGLTDAEVAQWHNGPELRYASGASLSDVGAVNVGTWQLPAPFASGSNGSVTYDIVAVNAAGTVLDSATDTASTTDTFDLSANAGNICYLLVRAKNTGGYDVGDYATRTSGYGSSNDGYYEIASVTAAAGGGGVTATPGVEGLTLSTFAPTVTATSNETVVPSVLSLTLATFAPTATASDSQSVTPDVASLSITGFAPNVTASDAQLVTPDTAILTITVFAPTVTASDEQTVTPDVASLTLTTFAPTVTATDDQTVTPGIASLTISTFVPTIQLGDSQSVTPGTVGLTLATFAPSVIATANQTFTPDTLSLSLSTFAPTVTAGDAIEVTPDIATLAITGLVPTIAISDNQIVTPDTLALIFEGYVPSVGIGSGDITLTPSTATLTLTTHRPNLGGSGSFLIIQYYNLLLAN